MESDMIEPSQIAKMKTRTFGVLCSIRALCERHDIRYFIVGGTLLGAIRHGGFIPWDDDVDVAMPRDDYERFLTLANELPTPVKLSHARLDDGQVYPFVQVYDDSTRVVMDYVAPYSRGAWVDVFPIDGMFETPVLRKLHWKAVRFLRSMTMNRTRSYYRRRVKPSARLKFIGYGLLNRMISKRLLYRIYDRLVSLKPFGRASRVAIIYGRYHEREIVMRGVFESTASFQFEGQTFQGPARYHEYLESIYGNYMEFPPQEKRNSGHRFLEVSIP
jgi:lipopolysaccharide cholinephosphotransferase